MIRVPLHELREDDVLARSVTNPSHPDKPLVESGQRLNQRMTKILRRLGIRSVWTERDGQGLLADLVSEEGLSLYRELLRWLQETFRKISAGQAQEADFMVFRDKVLALWNLLRAQPRVYVAFDDVHINVGDMTIHAANVCHLSLLLGLEQASILFPGSPQDHTGNAADFLPLGLGALLHDAGKMKLRPELLHKEDWELSQREQRELESHTTGGYRLLRPYIGAIAANIPLCHHLHVDGSGFPVDIEESGSHLPDGKKVHPFSRLVAVTNAFEELSGRADYLALAALEELNCARPQHFAAEMLAALNRVVPPFSLGLTLTLSSGHGAAAVEFDPAHPFRPTVLMLTEANGEPLPASQRVKLNLKDYPKAKIVALAGRSIEHLLPPDPEKGWEE